MKNVDCDYMGFESHECRHKEISNGWFRRMFPKSCMEYNDKKCSRRESMWDELKKEHTVKLADIQKVGRGNRTPRNIAIWNFKG